MLPPSGGRAERRGRYGRVEGLKVLPPSGGASGAEGALRACGGFKSAAPLQGGERSGGGQRARFFCFCRLKFCGVDRWSDAMV